MRGRMWRLATEAIVATVRCLAVVSAFVAVVLATSSSAAEADPAGSRDTASRSRAIWKPKPTDTWHWQLQGTLKTGLRVKIYDIDLFETSSATIGRLKARGVRVLCYFSAGSSESWRPDFKRFRPSDMGNPLDGWAGERWLDVRSTNVRAVMRDRIRLAARKGCDGVEPDNVDGFEPDNESSFDFGPADQLSFNRFLAREAHRSGLAVALKNDMAQVRQLVDDFDLAVNEQCHQYDECGVYAAFTVRGKLVMNAEYASRYRKDPAARETLCRKARQQKLKTVVLPLALDGSFRLPCP